MLHWNDVIRYADLGNPQPAHKISKSEDEWRAQLTPEQFVVARQRGTERASAPRCATCSNLVCMPVFVVEPNCLIPARSSNQAPVGHPLLSPSSQMLWPIMRIMRMECNASKPSAIPAMRTWGMYFPMVRRQVGCVIASMQLC